jgi:hypothetical protein
VCAGLFGVSAVAAYWCDRFRDEYDRLHPIPGAELQDGSGD